MDFRIVVPPDAPIGQYILPIRANISLESTFPFSFLNLNYYMKYHGYTTVPANLTITVQQPLTLEEQFREFWNTYGGIIGLTGGGFAAGFSALLIDRLKKDQDPVLCLNIKIPCSRAVPWRKPKDPCYPAALDF